MIPFTQPFAAPDGSTRRPLSVRVPQCVPPFMLVFCPSSANDAMFRCSVLDWILDNEGDIELHKGGRVDWGWDTESQSRDRTAENLNEAAHMIADAMGVEP